MSARGTRRRKVVLARDPVTDSAIDQLQVAGLDGEYPAFQVVRRSLQRNGGVEDTVVWAIGRERLTEVLADQSLGEGNALIPFMATALELMEEAAAEREAEEAAAREAEEASAPARQEGDEGPGQPLAATGVDTPEELRAMVLQQQEQAKREEEARREERRHRSRWFVKQAGNRILRDRPPWLGGKEWCHAILEELDWAGWWEAYDDLRIRAGDLAQVWEAVAGASAGADAERDAAHGPKLFGISPETPTVPLYPARDPDPRHGSFEKRFGIRYPLDVPVAVWRGWLMERLNYADWVSLVRDAEAYRDQGGAFSTLNGFQHHLYLEMQERPKPEAEPTRDGGVTPEPAGSDGGPRG